MKRVFLTAGLLCFLLAATNGFAQSRISGTAADPTGALIPGVSVTATNTQTGVVTTVLSNESGAYNFASLQPGSYKVAAELPGFKIQTYDNVTLGTSDQIRLNFTLTVSSVAQSVEVSVDAQALLTTTSSSIGEVLSDKRVQDLPMVRQDVLDLVRIMPGMRVDPFGDQFSAFTGLPTNTINTTRDGLSVTDTRNNVLSGTTTMNPDLIGEVRVILSPVDAELGRGNGQVQVLTRSGTNQFRGSAVWNVRNTALSANSWVNNSNRDTVTGKWTPTPLDWRNTNQYTVSAGGPIKKNKTFIFALWDQNMSRTRTIVTTPVLTDTARRGIFRYFDNYNSGDAHFLPPNFPIAAATNATYPVVDTAGNPVAPPKNPDGSPYTGSLRCFSVFGNVKVDGSPFTSADCPGGVALTGPAWDALRPTADQTGYIKKLLGLMPRANYFYQGGTAVAGTTVDGLNVAAFQWSRSADGISGAGGQGGTTPESIGRRQINLKFDHNLSARHRLGVGWTLQRDSNDDNLASWPGGFIGNSLRKPQVLTASFTSTLSASLVNEARYGISYQYNEVNPPWLSSDPDVSKGAAALLLQGGKGYPVAFTPGAGNFAYGNTLINNASTFSGSSSPLYDYADTVSYSRGRHAFRTGVDLRFTRSLGYSGAVVPTASGGAGGSPSPLANALAGLPNQLANTRTNAANMLYLLSGSLNTASTLYWIGSQDDAKKGVWQDYTTAQKKEREQVANEWAAFFKDDWKVKPSLTLNLGVRYEFYGSPYLRGGYTASVVDRGDGLFGVSRTGTGSPFEHWLLAPGNVYLSGYGSNVSGANALQCSNSAAAQNPLLPAPNCDPAKLTTMEYVGPGSDHPDKSAIRSDWGNIGPAVGFAWQVPWFGKGKTTIRAGYSLTYGVASRNAATTENVIGNVAGSSSTAALNVGDFPTLVNPTRALQLGDLPIIMPVAPTSPAKPGGLIPIYNKNTAVTAYDPNFKTPYTENLTFSVTRNVTRNMVVDIRYEGALGRRRADGGTLNVNLPNVYYNKELFNALEITRQGGDAPLFDEMLAGLNFNNGVAGYGAVGTTVNGVLQHGSAQLRRFSTFTNNLAIGNYQQVAADLNTLSTGATFQALPAGVTGVLGRLLRNGCDRIANGLYNPALAPSATNIPTRCFPENYIVANPQLSTASYIGGFGKSNFHSMQTQFTLRPTAGLSFQTTYIFAKTLGVVPGNWTDPLNRNADYAPPYQAVRHDLRTNGTFDLPMGPGRLLLSKSSGWVARLIEHWQTGMIFNVSSGNPRTLIGAHMFYATGNQNLDSAQNRVDIVSPLFDQAMKGHAVWNGPGNNSGLYYGDKFAFVPDPQCQLTNHTDSNGFNLFGNGSCTLQAVAMKQPDGSAPIVLQNPLPGHRGNMPFSLEAPGKWKFDANLSKRFKLTESKALVFRLDAQNVLNHPDLGDSSPITGQSINTAGLTFGQITSKGGNGSGALPRSFNLSIRLDF